MWSSASGVGTGVGSGVAVGEAGVAGSALAVGGAAEADGEADADPAPQAAMIGARAAVAPTTEIRWRSWRRVSRSSAR